MYSTCIADQSSQLFGQILLSHYILEAENQNIWNIAVYNIIGA